MMHLTVGYGYYIHVRYVHINLSLFVDSCFFSKC